MSFWFTASERFWNDFHSCLLKCVWHETYKPISTCGIFPEKVHKLEEGCGDNGFGCVQKQMCCVIWSSLKDWPSVGWRWGRYLTSWIPERNMDQLRLAYRSVQRESLEHKVRQTVANHRASNGPGTEFGSLIFIFVLRIARGPRSVVDYDLAERGSVTGRGRDYFLLHDFPIWSNFMVISGWGDVSLCKVARTLD
jgi:hypothetical protein